MSDERGISFACLVLVKGLRVSSTLLGVVRGECRQKLQDAKSLFFGGRAYGVFGGGMYRLW